jgi:hypothetical protein
LWDSARIFPQIHISVLLLAKIPIEEPQSDGAFFLIRVGSVGKKVFFCGWKGREKVLAKSGCCGVFSKKGTTESILHNLTL